MADANLHAMVGTTAPGSGPPASGGAEPRLIVSGVLDLPTAAHRHEHDRDDADRDDTKRRRLTPVPELQLDDSAVAALREAAAIFGATVVEAVAAREKPQSQLQQSQDPSQHDAPHLNDSAIAALRKAAEMLGAWRGYPCTNSPISTRYLASLRRQVQSSRRDAHLRAS